jgi:putative NADH-flavin reductase
MSDEGDHLRSERRGVGGQLVERALLNSHHVTAAARTVGPNTRGRLRALPCEVLDAHAVSQAIAGQDVVLCALGADNRRGPTTLYSTGARNIVQGMQVHQVRRLIFLSNFGVLDETAQDLRGATLLFLARRVLRHTLADHRRALDEIREGAAEWIVVRPLPLTDGPWTGRYRVAVDGLPAKGTRIARADVADFMIQQVSGDQYLHKVPAIAY